MARFNRKVSRNKTDYKFTQKEVEVIDDSIKGQFKRHFGFHWIHFNLRTIIAFVIGFMFTTLLVIPALMNYMDDGIAFILGHTILTSLLIVGSSTYINKDEIKPAGFLFRYIFVALLIGATSFISLMITSWIK